MYRRALLFVLVVFFIGPPNIEAGVVYPFKGEIDFIKGKASVDLDLKDQSVFNLQVHKISEHTFNVKLDIEELKTSLFEISTQLQVGVELIYDQANEYNRIKGVLGSQYTLFNRKPIHELSGNIYTKDKRLFLNAVSFGNIICNGYIDLFYPFEQDIQWILSSVSLQQFLNFWVRNKTLDSEGLVSGEIKSSGNIQKLVLKGSLDSYQGYIKNVPFDNLHLNAEGIYPKLNVFDSLLSKKDGLSYTFEGPFDLSKKGTYKKQIKEMTISPLVASSESDLEWTIKRIENEDDSTTELKYLLRGENGVGTTEAENEGMLGVERTMKF